MKVTASSLLAWAPWSLGSPLARAPPALTLLGYPTCLSPAGLLAPGQWVTTDPPLIAHCQVVVSTQVPARSPSNVRAHHTPYARLKNALLSTRNPRRSTVIFNARGRNPGRSGFFAVWTCPRRDHDRGNQDPLDGGPIPLWRCGSPGSAVVKATPSGRLAAGLDNGSAETLCRKRVYAEPEVPRRLRRRHLKTRWR